jgi:hypothetical protein
MKYLLGPLPVDEVQRSWQAQRERGECKLFGSTADADVLVPPTVNWDDVARRFPEQWRPEAVFVETAWATIPPAFWQAPQPLIAVARDWDLHWHGYRMLFPDCDWVLADPPGAAVLRRGGISHVTAVNLTWLPDEKLNRPAASGARDIDVLCVLPADIPRCWRSLQWFDRLADLGRRWKVLLHAQASDDEFDELARRSRIVVQFSIHGECGRQSLAAAAAGALLFQEAGNNAVPRYLAAGREHIPFSEYDLEALIERYLGDEDRRLSVTAGARSRVRSFTADHQWKQALAALSTVWPQVKERCQARLNRGGRPNLLGRVWQALRCKDKGDPSLTTDLLASLANPATQATFNHSLGLLHDDPMESAGQYRSTLAIDTYHTLAAFNLAFALVADPQSRPMVVDVAQRALGLLAREPHPSLHDEPPDPRVTPLFRIEWERAGWEYAGRPQAEAQAKRRLLRWGLHMLLSRIPGASPEQSQLASMARSDLPTTQGALAAACYRIMRHPDAIAAFWQELSVNPLDNEAARGLVQVLAEFGDFPSLALLAERRRLLSSVAATDVPPAPWFQLRPPTADRSLRVAVITVVHNEEDLILPFLDHYRSQGVDTVFVIDNESTDRTVDFARQVPNVVLSKLETGGSGDELVRYSAFNRSRAACIGQYDYVILVDADEFLVPKEGWLKDTLAQYPDHDVFGSTGFEVVLGPNEGPYDPSRPILGQRGWGVLNPEKDKPIVLRPEAPVRLAIGMARIDGPVRLPPVAPFWLYHFAGCDERLYFKRRRRNISRQGERNRRLGLLPQYTNCTDADLQRRWFGLSNHPQRHPLPTAEPARVEAARV